MLIFNGQFPISKSLCVAGTAALVVWLGSIRSTIPVPVGRAATHTNFSSQRRATDTVRISPVVAGSTQQTETRWATDPIRTSPAALLPVKKTESDQRPDSRGSPPSARSRCTSGPPARSDFQFSIYNCRLLNEPNFFAAIRTEESYDGKVLVGDGGLSNGPYHITRAYWADACEQGNVEWDYDTLVNSRPHCEQIMVWYFQRYCPDALKRASLKTLARIHNGGPKGHRKTATLEYWRRIQKHMAAGSDKAQPRETRK